MLKAIVLGSLLYSGSSLLCINNNDQVFLDCLKEDSKQLESYTARITYYSNDSKWGNKVACQTSKVAKEGITVAAHPDFGFGTKIIIPELKDKIGNGEFEVQDRGSAVTKKVASRGKAYVFDVYVSNKNKISTHAVTKPEYMKVYVVKP